MHLGCTARKLDPQNKSITDDEGAVYNYEKLLLATGGTPRRLMFGGDDILYFRTLDDYHRLREWSAKGEHFVVIGGGFIGSELVAALSTNGKRVTMVFPEAGVCSRILPRELTKFVTDYYRNHGVEIVAETMIAGMETRDGKRVLQLRDAHDHSERELAADGVVAGNIAIRGEHDVPEIDTCRFLAAEGGRTRGNRLWSVGQERSSRVQAPRTAQTTRRRRSIRGEVREPVANRG